MPAAPPAAGLTRNRVGRARGPAGDPPTDIMQLALTTCTPAGGVCQSLDAQQDAQPQHACCSNLPLFMGQPQERSHACPPEHVIPWVEPKTDKVHAHLGDVHSQLSVDAGALDAQQDAKVKGRPVGVGRGAVHALMVALQAGGARIGALCRSRSWAEATAMMLHARGGS
jgi:hypothetical protein